MQTMFATFLIFGLAVLGMAVGVMFGRRRLSGSCGGVPGGSDCTCSVPRQKACQARAIDEDYHKQHDDHVHLDVLQREANR